MGRVAFLNHHSVTKIIFQRSKRTNLDAATARQVAWSGMGGAGLRKKQVWEVFEMVGHWEDQAGVREMRAHSGEVLHDGRGTDLGNKETMRSVGDTPDVH